MADHQQVAERHPPGLKVLFFTEMWERFGYYLMLGIFVLYMTDSERGGRAFDTEWANEIYGWFIALVYLTPFAGGIIADRFLGYRKSVIFGGLLMAFGYLGVGWAPGAVGFYASLALVVLGNGFFKPNISSIVGRLYPEGSPLRDAGYNIFYMGINIGAFVCNFVAAILRNRFGWEWAFSAAGIGMFLAVIWFVLGQRQLEGTQDRGDGAEVSEGILLQLCLRIFLPAIGAGVIGFLVARSLDLGGFFTPTNVAFLFAVVPIVGYYIGVWLKAPAEEKGPIAALLAIFGVVVIFWMIFHQNGNTLTLWARDNTDRVAGATAPLLEAVYMDEQAPASYWENVPPGQRPAPGERVTLVSTELYQSINPFFVVTLTPLVVAFFAFLRKRNKEPSTPAKIAWGLMITAASTLIMVAAVEMSRGGEVKASPWWLVGTYGVITVGELCLSPMGLALVSKLAPRRVTGLMMGGWFLATAIGNKLSGVIGSLWEKVDSLSSIFLINCAAALGAAILMALLVPWIRRVMAERNLS
ncbi:MAG: peptide MFS transporter [Acidobacteriota bacterium]|nr:peptide MFS transporter [Acidobacteriota bacterium]MDQ7086602.1 peptide MFS transporter [Acidobacteriota bacterium]